MDKSTKGFTACGKYYVMGETQECYIQYCKNLMNEIRKNSQNLKYNRIDK